MLGADGGIREAREGVQEPERKERVMALVVREYLKARRISGVSSRSPWGSDGLRSGVSAYAAHVRRRLGRVASRRTELL